MLFGVHFLQQLDVDTQDKMTLNSIMAMYLFYLQLFKM